MESITRYKFKSGKQLPLVDNPNPLPKVDISHWPEKLVKTEPVEFSGNYLSYLVNYQKELDAIWTNMIITQNNQDKIDQGKMYLESCSLTRKILKLSRPIQHLIEPH